jgi:signal transduction histidine kinase
MMSGNGLIENEAVPRLTQVGRALTYATSLDEVLRLTVECAADLLAAEPVLLMLKNHEGVLEIRASHGFAESERRRMAGPMDELLIERLQDVFGAEAAERFVGVPLVVSGEIIGLLAATRPPAAEHARAEWLLTTLADQASIALETARHAEARANLENKLKAVQAAETAKDQALRILSHDLRTPLSTILSYGELIDSGMLGPVNERQRAALGRMRESGQHLIALLQNVLEMTRLTAGVVQLQLREFDIVSAVREAVDIAVTPRGVSHKFDLLPCGPVPVFADPVRVRQVIIHLIDNALKYTPAGTRVRLTCSTHEVDGISYGVVQFEDNGPGIPADRLAVIFEPFERAGEATGSAATGTGLGLAIARALVQQMGGSIEASSTVGQGTVFTLRLPVSAAG